MEGEQIVETTVGDLIATLTEEAIQFMRDEKEACNVVAFTVMHLLYNSGATSKTWQIWH